MGLRRLRRRFMLKSWVLGRCGGVGRANVVLCIWEALTATLIEEEIGGGEILIPDLLVGS